MRRTFTISEMADKLKELNSNTHIVSLTKVKYKHISRSKHMSSSRVLVELR